MSVVLLAIVAWYYNHRIDKADNKYLRFNGLSIFLLINIIFAFVIIANKNYSYSPLNFSDLFVFQCKGALMVVLLYLFTALMRNFGRFVNQKVFLQKPHWSLDVATGLLSYGLIMFALGCFRFLNPTTLLMVFFVFALVKITYFFKGIINDMTKPLELDGINGLGWASFFVMVLFLSANFLSNIAPFPQGFDSRNFYVNISEAVALNSSLIEGFQPYNWSLIMATGSILFEHIHLTLGISFLGFVLCLVPAYKIATDYLDLNKNYVLCALALVSVSPAIANQLFVELKVDFGLLFFQLVSLWYFFKLTRDNERPITTNRIIRNYLLLGLLVGFGLGIKLINLFLVFTLNILIWWSKKHVQGLYAVILLSTTFLMFSGVDETSGLADSHLSLGIVKIVSLVAGLALLGMSFMKDREYTLNRIMKSAIFVIGISLPMIPWIAKNAIESEDKSLKSLILGKNPGPDLNTTTIINNYEKK